MDVGGWTVLTDSGFCRRSRHQKFIKLCAQPCARTGADFQLTVLADRWIQRWSLNAATGAEQYLFEDFDMFKQIRDGFHQKVWSNRDIGECEVRLLDMHATAERTVLVLAGAGAHTPQFHYALCTFVERTSGGYELRNFCQLRHTSFVSGEQQPAAMRLLVAAGGAVYVYDDRCVVQVTLNSDDAELCGSGEPGDKVEFGVQGDRLLGGMLFQRMPVFFLRQHGFVSVSLAGAPGGEDGAGGLDFLNGSLAADADASLNGNFLSQSMAGGLEHTNLSMFELNPDEVFDDSDAVSQLKAAFIYHLKKNASKCVEVLADLLAAGGAEVDLDGLVAKIARDLVDDVPAADPRWEQRIGQTGGGSSSALGSSASMQIIQQLKEKKLVLQHFIDFLHATELWPQLQSHGERSGTAVVQRPTALILSDISEKVEAAIALKKIHNAHTRLIDDAIQLVLRGRNEPTDMGTLTTQDLFYVQVYYALRSCHFHLDFIRPTGA